MNDTEKSGLISAIWILSCNDEKSLMLYESIKTRLGLSNTDEIKNLINDYGELFRIKLPESQLKVWQDEMKKNQNRPQYIIDIKDKSEREKIINNLKSTDGFRSQFRTETNAPKSDVTLINWGLEHIERRRKASIESKNEKGKWIKEGVIPILSIVVALVAVIASSMTQYYNNTQQEELKKYEISFKLRADSYASMIDAYQAAQESATLRDKTNLQKNLRQLEFEFLKIKPFLSKEARGIFSLKFQELSQFLNQSVLMDKEKEGVLNLENLKQYNDFKSYFTETLFEDVFENSPYVTTPGVYSRVR